MAMGKAMAQLQAPVAQGARVAWLEPGVAVFVEKQWWNSQTYGNGKDNAQSIHAAAEQYGYVVVEQLTVGAFYDVNQSEQGIVGIKSRNHGDDARYGKDRTRHSEPWTKVDKDK